MNHNGGSFSIEEQRRIAEFYRSFYADYYNEDSELRIDEPKDELYLGASADRTGAKPEARSMIVCKSFGGSGFLHFVGTDSRPSEKQIRSPFAQEVIKNTASCGYGFCAGVEYLLAEGFLGIGGVLMIAIGFSGSLYGFNFYSGHIGMMR